MIKLEKTDVFGFGAAIRGMRNPLNSWDKSDSKPGCRLKKGRDSVDWETYKDGEITFCDDCNWVEPLCWQDAILGSRMEYFVGKNDLALMKKLSKAGSDHAKYLRMINVTVDITAPLYWWKEYDTYKVGTVANSCSTMHKIHDKEFTLDDFSHEHLLNNSIEVHLGNILTQDAFPSFIGSALENFKFTIDTLNAYRKLFIETNDKKYWWQLIQLLPSSYNQKRTVQLNYQVLKNMYHARKNHKLDEWHDFCSWIETLPYSELITGGDN